ncbi:hypothetical protein N172_04405 [Pantoea dispersa EGD-AAK13]|uniref:hypothetical protein n=1 Tax=Pantoea TaxID=53335 RepID=UPI0003970A71|nr:MULTISPECIES: hypothetical protein [Pantoea]ERH64431.1 hypothetical protein N172_04405 [Pantoea dispersa EGD-AAK13]MBS0897058.1 hypothetical protein [Pantoea dispersa]
MMVPYDEGWRQYQIDISPTSIMELSFFDSDHKFNYQIFDNFLSNAVVMRAGAAVAR